MYVYVGDKFYPGTGNEAANSTCSPTAAANATSSTGTGAYSSSSSGKGNNVINIGLTPVGPGPWLPPLRSKLTGKQRAQLRVQASKELRYTYFLHELYTIHKNQLSCLHMHMHKYIETRLRACLYLN